MATTARVAHPRRVREQLGTTMRRCRLYRGIRAIPRILASTRPRRRLRAATETGGVAQDREKAVQLDLTIRGLRARGSTYHLMGQHEKGIADRTTAINWTLAAR